MHSGSVNHWTAFWGRRCTKRLSSAYNHDSMAATKKPAKHEPKTQFITTKLAVGVSPDPKTGFDENELLPLYQRLQKFPEYTGASYFTPPRPQVPPTFTNGFLSAADNSLRTDISRANISTLWTNQNLTPSYDLKLEDIQHLVKRIIEETKQELFGVFFLKEYAFWSVEPQSAKVFTPKVSAGVKHFFASITYPRP